MTIDKSFRFQILPNELVVFYNIQFFIKIDEVTIYHRLSFFFNELNEVTIYHRL